MLLKVKEYLIDTSRILIVRASKNGVNIKMDTESCGYEELIGITVVDINEAILANQEYDF